MEVLKKSAFWKRFLKYLSVGLSCMVILYFFQTNPTTLFAEDYVCPTNTGTVSFITTSGQTLPAGISSTTISWQAAPNTNAYLVTVRTTGGATIFSDDNYTGTNLAIQNLQPGQSYVVSVRPKNNCGSGNLYQLFFSVATAPAQSGVCPNPNDCITCGGDDDGGYQICPTPENNCSRPATCSDGGAGQFSCTITPQSQGGNNYSLAASPNYFPYQNYLWDLDGNFSYETQGVGPNIPSRSFPSNNATTVRLQVRDGSNNLWACSTTINPSSATGNYPICTITASPSNNVSAGTNVTFTGNGTAYNGKYINSYQWDFDNNGVYDTSVNNFNTASSVFNTPQTVRLHVIDSAGLGNDCTTYINVGNQYPVGSCTTDTYRCPDGNYVSRNPNNACNFYACSNTGANNQCRSANCSSLPAGCYYTVQPLTYTCDPNAQLTCGEWTCPNPSQPTPGNPTFPSFPNPFGGNSQNTWVGVSNINNNENNNSNYSNSFSDSWASGGGGGSSNVTINW